jgi:hypothetical protein
MIKCINKRFYKNKFSIKQFKIKIFKIELIVNCFIVKKKDNYEKKIFTNIILEKDSWIKKNFINFCIRNSSSCLFFPRLFIKKKNFRFIFSFEQFINRIKNNNIFLLLFFCPKETIAEKKNELMEYFFLSQKKKNQFLKQPNDKKFSILIIISNQNSFFQIISYLSNLKQKQNINLIVSKKFYKELFFKIQFGKIIKPADNRTTFLDGYKDFLSIGADFKKKKLYFTKKIFKPNFLFLTPLVIRSLKKPLFLKILNFCKISFIESISIIFMQNIENLFLVLKYFLHLNKKRIFYKREKNLNKNFINYHKIFPFFVILDHFSSHLFFLLLLNRLKFLSVKNFFIKFSKKINFFIQKKFILIKIKVKKKIFSFKKILAFFKKNLTLFILKKAKKGILLFFKKYFDYVLIRNHFIKMLRDKKKYKIVFLNEYLDFSEIVRRKFFFNNNENIIILCTERFYHFYRYKIHNLSSYFFYYFPLEWEFLNEIVRIRNKVDSNINIYIFGN